MQKLNIFNIKTYYLNLKIYYFNVKIYFASWYEKFNKKFEI